MKTVIVDFSGILHATYRCDVEKEGVVGDEKLKLWRYYILNSIALIRSQHKPDEMIFACDRPSWRAEYFQYYKAKRKINKIKSNFNYKEFFEMSTQIQSEIEKVFPYKFISIDNAEADDIISILTTELKDDRKEIVIISEDKDFKQLLRFKNVKLYSMRRDIFYVGI